VADPAYPALAADAVARAGERLVDLVRQQFGELSPDQVEEVRGRVAAQIAAAEKLHAFPLTNADEPAFVLDLGPGESS
jgi:hypothetical protein